MESNLSEKDRKSLISNFSWLFCLKVAGYLFPLLTVPYLARVIGVSGYGKIAFASAVTMWVMTITNWGFSYTATRDVARCREDVAKVSDIYSDVLWSRLFVMVVCLSLLSFFPIFLPSIREEMLLLFFSLLSVPGHVLFPDWFFQAMEKMKYITIFNFFIRLFFTAMVFLFVKEGSDYVLHPFFLSLGFISSGILAQIIIVRKWHVKLRPFSFPRVVETLKKGADIFIAEFMPNLYNSFSQMLLSHVVGYSANGMYDAGNKFFMLAKQFFSLLSQTFFPVLSRNKNGHGIYAKLSIILSLIVSFLLFVGAPYLIGWFYTEEFSEAVGVLRVLAVSFPFLVLWDVYGVNGLVLYGRETKYRQIVMWVSLSGFVLSFPLVYYSGFMGVACLLFLVRATTGVWTFMSAKKLTRRA